MDYSRVEVAADARRQPMKLWSSTANGLQRSRRRCEERSDVAISCLWRIIMRSPRFARDDNFIIVKVVRSTRHHGKNAD